MASSLVDGLSVILLLARDTERIGAFYRDVLDVPLVEEEHDGRHKMTLSFDDWKPARVAPTTVEVPIVEAPKPKKERSEKGEQAATES